jgi:hypothetical protein
MVSDRGNTVRRDWTVEAHERPTRRRWRQELAGTAFARIFRAYAVEVTLDRADDRTAVTLVVDQRPRGFARFAPWMLTAAMRRQLDAALDGLAAIVEDVPA